MSVVFISYSRKDSGIADDIREKLLSYELEAITPWQDKKDIRGGERWHLEIDRAIQDSFAMLIICTENSKTSSNVTYEWAYARGLGNIALIPIFFDRVDDRVPVQLQVEQGYDFNDSGSFWSRLIPRLQELQVNDSRTNLHIPWTTDNYIRQLATRAFYSTYIDDNLDAIKTLGTIDDPIAREILIIGLNHRQVQIRNEILNTMSNSTHIDFRDERAIPKLKELFLNGIHVKHILARMGKATIEALSDIVDHPNPRIRERVLDTIIDTQVVEVFPYLVDCLDSQDELLWRQALGAIMSHSRKTSLHTGWMAQFYDTLDEMIVPAINRFIEARDLKFNPKSEDELRTIALNCLQQIGTNTSMKLWGKHNIPSKE